MTDLKLAAQRALNLMDLTPLNDDDTDQKVVDLCRKAKSPAGLTAATLLARAGRRVVVHERNATVGARFVGDLQVIEDASDAAETVPALFASAIGGTSPSSAQAR